MAEIDKISENQRRVARNEAAAADIYDNASNAASGDDWLSDVDKALSSVPSRRQPEVKEPSYVPASDNSDWLSGVDDALGKIPSRPGEKAQPQGAVAAEAPKGQASGGKRMMVEIGVPTVEVEDNGVKKSPEEFLAGAEVQQQTRPKGIPDYTKAPTYPSVNESWAYTKTASIIDYNNPLEKGAMQARQYGEMLTSNEVNAIRNNTNWDDLARQSKALQEKYRGGGVDTSSTQYMHDAQLLAEIHNRMVNIELGVNGSVSKGERQYRLYADEMRRKGKYFGFYDGLLQNGADLRHWNPFMDLTNKVMARREADRKAGKNYPDNYYYHMALKDGEFRQKVHEYALALAKQTGMEWGEAKTWAARHSDRLAEQFKESRAKEFADSPWYSVTSALLDNSVADIVKTGYNTYDLIKGQPLRTEGVNDLLQRSMKYAGEGKNVTRGVLSFIPEAVTLMPVTGVAATRTVGALSKIFTFTPRAMKITTGSLSFMGYEMAKTALGAISRGEDINWAEMAGNSAKGFILGGGGALISEGVAGIAPRVNSTAANYAIQGVGKVAEVGQFASFEMAMAYLGNDKETTWTSSLLNNGALIVSMAIGHGIGHGFGFKSRISTNTIEKVRKAGYNTLANEMAKHTQAVERGAMPKGYSQAAIQEMQSMQQNMGRNGLSWSDYAEVLKPTNSIMTKPGTNSIEKVKDGKGYRIVSYDVNGVEIERSKVYNEATIDKKFAKRQREVEKKREEANVKSFDIMRESTINAKAARAVADALNQEDGKSVYNTDGTVNEAFDGITADDILNAYEVLSEKPAEQLSESEARLVSMFKQQAEQIGAGLLDSQGVKRTICERYGISEEAFDAAWKDDAKDRKGKEAEACAAYNTAISRDYSVTAGIETARGAVDGAEATIKSRIETNAEGLPLDPNQKVYYELADGETRVTTAEHVLVEPQAEDPGVLGDRIANDNLTKLINEKTEEVRANFAEVSTEDLEDSLNALRNAIKYEGDEDGSKRLLSIALTKEIESRRAAESEAMRAEWNGMTHGEKVQHFVDKKFSGRTQEEREELTRYYTEHPSEFDDVLSYDGTHSAEISALVDSMGLTDSKEWNNKYKEYKENEESFRKDFKKKFGVEPTERPYGFEQKESEIATPRSTDESPIELNENGTVVGGDATQESPIELDGEGKVVNTEQGTAPVAESRLVDVVGIPEEYREDWQRYWEQYPPKDAIDVLLDGMDVMDEGMRGQMRKSYEENPDFFQKEWGKWMNGISVADVERALGLEPTVREEVRTDEVQEQKEPTPANGPVAEKPAVEPIEAPKPENKMQPAEVGTKHNKGLVDFLKNIGTLSVYKSADQTQVIGLDNPLEAKALAKNMLNMFKSAKDKGDLRDRMRARDWHPTVDNLTEIYRWFEAYKRGEISDREVEALFDSSVRREILKEAEEEKTEGVAKPSQPTETPQPENAMQPAKVETETPPIEGVEQEPFDSFTTSKGKKVNLYRQTSEKDGIKTTRVVATKDGKETNVATAHFPLPDEYEIDPAYLADGEIGDVLGVNELRESKDGAAATIVVRDENGLTLYEVKLNKKSESPKPENEMQPVKVEGTEEDAAPPAAETDNATVERNRKIDELLDFMGIEGEEREGYREGYISNPEALDEDYNDYLAEKQKEETEEAPKDEEPSKEEPTTEGPAEPRIVDNLDEAMPMLDDGEPNVELATPRRTRHYLYEESGLEAKDATDKVDYEIKKAKEAAKKAEKGEPKMSDKGIDGNIGKLKKAKQEWNDKKAAADAKFEYWNEVKRQQGLYDLIDEIGETKTPKSMADLIVKLKSRFKNDAEISSALNSYTVEPRNMYEACMLYLGSGVRFVWDSEGARKGLKQELGYGDEERSKMVGLLSKDGITVQRAVHDIVDQYGADLGFDLSRSQEVYDTLIDALSSVSTRGDVFAFINERRLNAVEDILRKRLGNGDVQSREESEADIRANEEFEALKEQYKDELPENPTEDDVLNLMERKRQEREDVNVEGERQTEDTLPDETGVSDDFFENGGEDEYVPFRDGEEENMSADDVEKAIQKAKDNAEKIPEPIDFNKENWNKAFPQARVSTPLGDVKIGENQFEKMSIKGRSAEIGLMKATLERPDFVIEENSPQEGAERQSKYLFVKTFIKGDGSTYRHYESVTIQQEGKEISISSHYIGENKLRDALINDRVLYNKNSSSSNGSENRLAETQDGRSDLLPTPDENESLSDNKDTTVSSNVQENGEKTTESGDEQRFKVGNTWYGRDKTYGVGKKIGGRVYVHKDYAERVVPKDVLDKAKAVAEKEGFSYNCINYDPKNPNVVRFDEAPDFDTAREPITGRFIYVDTKTGEVIKTGSSNQIWHHKWQWVAPDYKGFDVQKSYEWSKEWTQKMTHPSGYRDKWDAALREVGLPVDGEGGEFYRTSEELNEQYPTWLSGQTKESGKHSTQIPGTVKSYNRIGDWMKKNGMDGASVLDASSGLGVGTQALRDMGFDVEDVEPYPDKSREAPTYSKYEDIDKEYDVVISNAVLNVIPDDWRADVLKSMADKLKVGGKLIINVRDAKSIADQKQKIELDSPSEILVTDKKGNITAYQKGFTKKELQEWVKSELGEGWEVEVANENNSGLKSGVAVVVTKGENAAPVRYRSFEPMGERGVKKVTQVRAPEYREGTDYFGRPMMHRVNSGQYKVEGYDDIFNSVEEVADFMRKKNPDYCVYIDEDGNIGYEAWSNILPEGVKPNTYAKILATNGGKLSSAMKKRIERYTQREMKQARVRAEEITKELGLDVEFHDDPSEFSGRKSKAKGWYDPKTGKIHVVMGNHSGVSDVLATMLHEGVAHHGLRKLFGEDFDTFLDNVHNNVSEDIRADINGRIDKMRGNDQEGAHSDEYYRRAATEEYLADLAEDGLYNGEQNTGYASRAWQYIKESFINLLRKAGINIELTDDELRYILWSSHKNLRRGAEAMAEDAVMREKAGIKDYVEDGEPVKNVAESGRQMSLFPEGNMRSLGGAREMRDAELLEEIGKDRYDVRSVYTDEYDRRHNREYNENYDSTTKMLEDDNTSIKQVEEMLIDAAYYLRNNYTSKERAVAMARFDAIQEYYFNKEAELEKARDDFFAKHEEELKERFGDYYDEEENIDKLMSEYGIVREPRVPYGAVSEAREILRGADDRFRDGEEEQQSDLAARLRERMRQRMERARGANNGGEEPRTESGSSGGIIPPVEPPTPSAPATPEPAPELPSTDYDRPMSPIEQAQAAAIKAVADTKASLEQRNAARRELTASLRNIHKAMGLQKEYDRATVENVVNLCKMMVQSGLIDRSYVSDLTPLFTKLKDATGKQDLSSTVNGIMDVMLKSQERSVRNEIAKLLNTKGTKVDQNGVVTQAGLDIRGQHTMKELSEYMGKGSVIIDNHISKLEEARARIPDGHQERIDDIDDKILGSQLAKQFSEIEETHSVNIREAEEDLNFLKERYKAGEIGVKEYTEQKHALENLIRSYRMAQTDALWNQANALRYVIAGSKEGTRNWIEQQKQHKNEILHNAYSDMEGASKQTQGDPTMAQKVVNMSVPKFFSSSLYTLQTLLKSLGNKHALGEGYLYNRFFRGWMEQRDAEITEYRDDMKTLNSKAKELTGHSYFGIYDMIQKLPKMTVEYMDGGEMLPHELDQGQLGYAYMVNKMEDGAAALRNMGITEEKMQEISNFLDPKLKEFYDWLQDDFLAGKWDGMNEVHKRLFGADMDRVANYIPLRRDRGAGTQKVDISQENEQPLQSTVVGSIIQRVHSNLGIDLKHNNAIDVVANHLLEATHWKHFSEWKRDANTLLSDTTFRNKVKNTTTIYGSGDVLWNRLNQVFQIAGGDYKPKAHSAGVDKAIVDMARTVNTAKVSMRVFTATKQLLSLPVFATECNTAVLLKNLGFLLSPVTSKNVAQNSFLWCLQNLPQFRERWVSRTAGETRLENGDLGWGYSRQKVLEAAGRIGLTPNAFIDVCTVAAGAKSIYEKRFAQYKKDGYSEEAASKKAKIDAETAFNESQQSSEKAFVSPIQVDRTAVALGLSTFRNASMGFERKFVDSIRNFRHLTDHKETVEFMKKQMERDGLTETQAKDAAERLYRRALWRSTLNFLMFGFGAQMAWNVGGKLPYLIFGDDEEEKKKIVEQAAIHAGIGGWIEGMPAGDMLSEGMTNWAMNLIESGNPLEGNSFFEFDPDLLTVTSDFVKVTKALEGKNPLKGATDFVNLLAQIYTGVNPQTFTDAGVAIYDACDGNPEVGNEALMCILRIMQCPQSQLDQMYIDELKMSAREAQKLTPEEVARRYAYYKAHKDTPYMWWMYNQDKKDEIVKKYEGDFNKKLNTDVKEEGGTPEDYHDLSESATTEKKTLEYRSKEIDALSAQGPEALMKAWEKERDKGAAADYKYMKSLMTRYQKDVYGKGKTPTDEDEAELYQETHGEDIKEQAQKIGRDLGFSAQDSYFQMSQYKAQHTSAKDPAMKKLSDNSGGFRYSEKGKFFDINDYQIKKPVEDAAKRSNVEKVVKENRELLKRNYRNGWRMARIKALYKDIEAEIAEGKEGFERDKVKKNFEEILYILEDERRDAAEWERTHPKVKFTKKIETY